MNLLAAVCSRPQAFCADFKSRLAVSIQCLRGRLKQGRITINLLLSAIHVATVSPLSSIPVAARLGLKHVNVAAVQS
jgi:hypothetical protein